MTKHIIHAMVLSGLLTASPLLAQVTSNPFPQIINTTDALSASCGIRFLF